MKTKNKTKIEKIAKRGNNVLLVNERFSHQREMKMCVTNDEILSLYSARRSHFRPYRQLCG